MNKNNKNRYLLTSLLILICGVAFAGNGSGDIKLGYTIIDEEGDPAVNQSTYNKYDGLALSVERFQYKFGNGFRINANLNNITLNNRNLNFGLRKSGLFGVTLANNQYRRKYDTDDGNFTRRHRTSGSIWFYPIHSLKLFIDGSQIGKSGKMTSLIEPEIYPLATEIDYSQADYNFGFRYNDKGRMMQAEYRTVAFDDNINSNSDRTSKIIRFMGQTPLPSFENVIINAGYQNFESEYKATDYKLISDRGWGGFKYSLPHNFYLNYNFIFDRTGSDSDFVKTDNLSHTAYLTHIWPHLAGLTAGYQNGVNDDFDGEINSDSYYFSGWLKPLASLEVRGEYGHRAEKVADGYRLTGKEDRSRFKFSVQCRKAGKRSIRLGYESRQRKNESISSEADFSRFSADGNVSLPIGNLNGGYSYSLGEYKNIEQTFEFNSHVLYGNLKLKEYKGFALSFGGVYYRGKKNLDIESFNLNLTASYKFPKDHTLELIYNGNNFDNFLEVDQFHTANIIEINIIKNTSF